MKIEIEKSDIEELDRLLWSRMPIAERDTRVQKFLLNLSFKIREKKQKRKKK